MPSPDAAARHTGAGVARRQAHHERMRDERAREAAAGNAELPPEDDAVEMASAAHVLDSVAEVDPNYTLLRSKETKAKRRKRKREDARAALNGHTVLSTGSRLEIFCDSERWYPATVMAREEHGDGRIVHEVEYDGYSDRRRHPFGFTPLHTAAIRGHEKALGRLLAAGADPSIRCSRGMTALDWADFWGVEACTHAAATQRLVDRNVQSLPLRTPVETCQT
ncbi:hypothetical protein EMIHUDRAFT_117795 [Emiliania huxleyi CCMP1516]|uniref:Tudor domain-containing protein n=2 Tax=Emiliania huxleyi TaxID=2903 RepID=A0A0D3J8M9_EMIH1|nr:hypothetical protein EMIHUDRAFT_117795 [Emiliania huxleyi CCMP1516]EOD19864.1 hypothetical protein EMIHUDRAFT_117795 [Emiliania huxleyi CCMP1516]|eukprot:XP_005772293.1 hypothetical protein EMIHUDRAFT_117795 [Emiliania huxleyi CCMP1516]